MKRLLLLGLILISTAAFSQVTNQQKPTKEEMEKRKQEFEDKMNKELKLTPEQIQQVNAIDQKYKGQEDTLRSQLKTLRESKKAEIDKVLTDEQKLKLKDMRQKLHGNDGMKKGGGHCAFPKSNDKQDKN